MVNILATDIVWAPHKPTLKQNQWIVLASANVQLPVRTLDGTLA